MEIETKNQSPQMVETDMGKGSEPFSLGKFNNAEELYKAYGALQAEFTKRCQRVAELEAQIKRETAKIEMASPNAKELDKEKILREYLMDLEKGKSQAIVIEAEGVGVKTPKAKPTTVSEAGKLAKEFLR